MSPDEIRAELKRKRLKIVDIAATYDLKGPNIHRAIDRRARHRRAEEAVASALGLSREEIFGPPSQRERKPQDTANPGFGASRVTAPCGDL